MYTLTQRYQTPLVSLLVPLDSFLLVSGSLFFFLNAAHSPWMNSESQGFISRLASSFSRPKDLLVNLGCPEVMSKTKFIPIIILPHSKALSSCQMNVEPWGSWIHPLPSLPWKITMLDRLSSAKITVVGQQIGFTAGQWVSLARCNSPLLFSTHLSPPSA